MRLHIPHPHVDRDDLALLGWLAATLALMLVAAAIGYGLTSSMT